MSKTTPAFQALSLSANTSTPPAADWKHPLGRPRRPWLQQLKEDTGLSISVGPIVVEVAIRPSASQAHMIEYRLHFRRKIRNNRITDRQKDKSTYYTHMNAYRLYDSINLFLRIYVSIDNRPVYRHRIANFPNYVTLTSSLTHHRIVNLGGPRRYGHLRQQFYPLTHPLIINLCG